MPNRVPEKLQELLVREDVLVSAHSRQFYQGEYRIGEDETSFSHNHAHYNRLGNEIKHMCVYGNQNDNVIDMNMRTHDTILGRGGSNTVHGGWGDDHITSGNVALCITEVLSGLDDCNRSSLYGEEGNDIIVA